MQQNLCHWNLVNDATVRVKIVIYLEKSLSR